MFHCWHKLQKNSDLNMFHFTAVISFLIMLSTLSCTRCNEMLHQASMRKKEMMLFRSEFSYRYLTKELTKKKTQRNPLTGK